MRRAIDPAVDCVFKAILGREHHRNLLIHFLNAMLDFRGSESVAEVILRNPFHIKNSLSDKYSVVDVKAVDQRGREFQIEIQISGHEGLAERILYTWSALYAARIKEGQDYDRLKPVISIWLLLEDLFPGSQDFHLPFGMHQLGGGTTLSSHCAIHLFQLKKWQPGDSMDDKGRWLSFFKSGKYLDRRHPPEWMDTPEMRQVMEILKEFSDVEENYHAYLSRMEGIYLENTRRNALKRAQDALARKEEQLAEAQRQCAQELAETERQRTRLSLEKERQNEEIARLHQLLRKAGIDPNAT